MTTRFQQTGLISVADRVVRVATGRGLGAAVSGSATSPVAASLTFAVASGQRELRLDLFRGLALWLIYIDHVSPDILTWGTIRSYGFQRRCGNLHFHLRLHGGAGLWQGHARVLGC